MHAIMQWLSFTSSGRFAVAHHESWVASVGTEARLGESEESLDSSALTCDTREVGEYRDQIQDGCGDIT